MGRARSVPDSGIRIALMMGLQESGLQNLANATVPESLQFPHDGVGSDHDSLGSAQQRPADGWGTVGQLMQPAYDAAAFYGGPQGPNHGSPPGLLDIPGWQGMDPGEAVQAVQNSAFPEQYSQWRQEADAILEGFGATLVPTTCGPRQNAPGPTELPAGLSQLRREIITRAQEGIGGKYVWGGAAFKAWDCSGYVQWVYGQVGINLPRTEQWSAGKRIMEPQIGDLVVQNPDGPNHWGHIGIYAGNGLMYSALNPAVGTLLHPVGWNHGTAYFAVGP
ncbi:NlpC/P60 family protein [Arthrobacter sp. STN4]|uniref:C40 family peptidase n=1 Tax=Arthrobacter sp. STN4 TaxID=2923276 RepID=UPI00211A26E4|nr:NlpC/P60 family protein [Arthrobacter sp. STN4]MCQ9163931.1 NlpC/P60 family protein [Arthrobacter sp. STN4]